MDGVLYLVVEDRRFAAHAGSNVVGDANFEVQGALRFQPRIGHRATEAGGEAVEHGREAGAVRREEMHLAAIPVAVTDRALNVVGMDVGGVVLEKPRTIASRTSVIFRLVRLAPIAAQAEGEIEPGSGVPRVLDRKGQGVLDVRLLRFGEAGGVSELPLLVVVAPVME